MRARSPASGYDVGPGPLQSFLVNWFWSALNYLGLSNKSARIVFLGLDNAGKTTLLHTLRDGKVIVHEPTRHPQADELVIGNIRFKTHDLGGHAAARRLWKQYFTGIDGVVFLVDTTDHARIKEAGEELSALLMEESLAKVPFLILGNKIDAPGACNEAMLTQTMEIDSALTDKAGGKLADGTRPIQVFMCSVFKRSGYADGFKWLANYLN